MSSVFSVAGRLVAFNNATNAFCEAKQQLLMLLACCLVLQRRASPGALSL
jgi:hypothetical protein